MATAKKDSPFDPITKVYLDIEELKLNPVTNKLHRTFHHIPDQIISVKPSTRVRQSGSPLKLGRSVRLPKSHYLAALILRNEILSCLGKATDREGLLRNMRHEYRHTNWSANASRKYLERFSSIRSDYNHGQLFKNQPMPPLYCFWWNPNGYIRHPRYRSQYLSFKYCKRELQKARFADPRFFTPKELNVIIHSLNDDDPRYKNWTVPAWSDIERIEAEIKRPLYDSIKFPSGYDKSHDPI